MHPGLEKISIKSHQIQSVLGRTPLKVDIDSLDAQWRIAVVEALERKDLLFFTFMVLVAFVSFSENLLDVDKGILFYAFFFSFFMFSSGEMKNAECQLNVT